MERYTKLENGGNAVIRGDSIYSDWGTPEGFRGDAIDRLAAYEDVGLEPEEVAYFLGITMSVKEAKTQYAEHKKRYDEWFAWKQAEEEGRLLVLPCKVGDTVWRIKKGICPKKGTCVSGDVCSEMIMGVCPDYSGKPTVERSNFRLCDYNDVGKTVFHTREEAEEKLKEISE